MEEMSDVKDTKYNFKKVKQNETIRYFDLLEKGLTSTWNIHVSRPRQERTVSPSGKSLAFWSHDLQGEEAVSPILCQEQLIL